MIELLLPYPPSVNHYWRHVGHKTLISRGGRLFRSAVVAAIQPLRITALSGPLDVSIRLHPPDRRRRDVDNTLKPLLDAMQHAGVYGDDSQIKRLTVEMFECVSDGSVIVFIEERSQCTSAG